MAAYESSAAKRTRTPERGPQPPRFIAIEGPLRVGTTPPAKLPPEPPAPPPYLRLRRQSLPRRFLRRKARLGLPCPDVFPTGTPEAPPRSARYRSSRPGPLRLPHREGPHFRQSQSRRRR